MTQFTPHGLYRQPANQPITADIDIELSACENRERVLEHLGRALNLPDWYGANFDALADCLGDPDWHDGAAIVIRLSGLSSFSQRAPADYALLLEALDTACQVRSDDGAALAVIIDDAPPGIRPWPTA